MGWEQHQSVRSMSCTWRNLRKKLVEPIEAKSERPLMSFKRVWILFCAMKNHSVRNEKIRLASQVMWESRSWPALCGAQILW